LDRVLPANRWHDALPCIRKREALMGLRVVELKPFVPARDFELSKRFYLDLGFTKASDLGGVAYFHHGEASFLLQDFYNKELAENLMLHLLVEDVAAWHAKVEHDGLAAAYGVQQSELVQQPWHMRDFTQSDPSGVLWRIAQNIA
jgi:catechol 2,3-dioxygenase-like lactoylglutathione lyase family enzyme